MKRKVLITGAAGNIGAKLAAHFGSTGQYDLALVDRVAGEGIIAADLSVYDETWAQLFDGVDTVVHMAGEPRGTANWNAVLRLNVRATQNVLRAARQAKIRRVVFASTNQVMLGYRFRGVRVTTDMPPAPLSPYAISKLYGEQLGRGFSAETGISFIALRVGYLQPGENIPSPAMGIGLWGQQSWLSDRDMALATECAIEAEDVRYAVVNLESRNEGMLWDIDYTRTTIGYVPRDSYVPVVDARVLAEDAEASTLMVKPGTWLDENFHSVEG